MASIPSTFAGVTTGTTAFFGARATVTTTANQRVTGVITAYARTSASQQVTYVQFQLCARAAGATSAPVGFGPDPMTTHIFDLNSAFTASDSAVLGAGTWEVGLCVLALSNDVSGQSTGWVMVTN